MLLPTTTWVAWENENKGRAGRGKSFPFVNLKHGKDTAFYPGGHSDVTGRY